MFKVANLKRCTFVVFLVICMLIPNLSLLLLFKKKAFSLYYLISLLSAVEFLEIPPIINLNY